MNVRPTVVALSLLLVSCGGGSVASSATDAGTGGNGETAGLASAKVPDGDWTRFDYNAQRNGVGPADTGIAARNARVLIRRVIHIDGVADSSAIQLHGIQVHGRVRDVAVLTTTYGRTIALDPGSGTRLWEYSPPDIGRYEGSSQITTATPIADPDRRYLYAASPDGLIRKLVLATGREVRSGWPTRITADPTREKIAGALNLSGSDVIAVTGGYYGDAPTYQGHVVLIDRASGHIAHVFNTLCSDRRQLIVPPSSCPASDSAIWARAGAVVEPGSHKLLVATGNGPFDGRTDWGDSVLELSADAGRLLHNWTPPNQQELASTDSDVGSTAPAVISTAHLAVQGGKDHKLHLLDLNRLDGTPGGAGPRLGGEVQELDAPGGGQVLTAPAVWTHAGRTYVFVADDAGTAAYVVERDRRLGVAWQDGTPGTSPVVAGGLLYVYDDVDGSLNIVNPTSGRTLASLPAGSGHWSSPIVVGGRIILPVGGSTDDNATSGTVYVYHVAGR